MNTRWKSWLFSWETAILLLALGLRLLHFVALRDHPVFSFLLGDSEAYDAWGMRIAQGDVLGKGVFYQAPLYPYFLGIIYALAGHSLLVVRLVQAMLGASSCVLLARAGTHFLGHREGLVAGFLLAIYPTAIFSDGLIQKSSLDLFLLTLFLLLLGRQNADQPGHWLPTGAVLGALMLTRENALVLVLATLAWLAWRWRAQPRTALAHAALFSAGLIMILLPVALRNLVVGGEFHLTTSQFGPNFYIGNNPEAEGTYAPLRPGGGSVFTERDDATDLAIQALGRPLTAGEVSRYWARQAFAYIISDPGSWLRLLARKSLLVLNSVELVDTDDQGSYAEWSPVLGFLSPLLHFGVLLPLAVAGVVLTWDNRRQLMVLYLMMATYAGSVAIFYIVARYRFPLVPMVAILAAAGVTGLVDTVRRRQFRTAATAITLAMVAAVPANWPLMPERVAMARAVMQNNLGVGMWNQTKKLDDVVPFYRESIRLDPEYAEPYRNLGLAYRWTGHPNEAVLEYNRALRLTPDDPDVLEGLGLTLSDLGRHREAIDAYRQAIAFAPTRANAHWGLAVNFQKVGLVDQANGHFSEAIRLDPRLAFRRR